MMIVNRPESRSGSVTLLPARSSTLQTALQTAKSNELAVGVLAPQLTLLDADLPTNRAPAHPRPGLLAVPRVGHRRLVTSLREGLALRTHEYVVECQEGHRPADSERGAGDSAVPWLMTLTRCAAPLARVSKSGVPLVPRKRYTRYMPQSLQWAMLTRAQALTISDDEALSRREVMTISTRSSNTADPLHNHVTTQTAQAFAARLLS
jgi:hypothetical protein